MLLMLLPISRACDDNEEEEQQSVDGRDDSVEDYYAYAYGFTPETWRALYHRPSARSRVPGLFK